MDLSQEIGADSSPDIYKRVPPRQTPHALFLIFPRNDHYLFQLQIPTIVLCVWIKFAGLMNVQLHCFIPFLVPSNMLFVLCTEILCNFIHVLLIHFVPHNPSFVWQTSLYTVSTAWYSIENEWSVKLDEKRKSKCCKFTWCSGLYPKVQCGLRNHLAANAALETNDTASGKCSEFVWTSWSFCVHTVYHKNTSVRRWFALLIRITTRLFVAFVC